MRGWRSWWRLGKEGSSAAHPGDYCQSDLKLAVIRALRLQWPASRSAHQLVSRLSWSMILPEFCHIFGHWAIQVLCDMKGCHCIAVHDNQCMPSVGSKLLLRRGWAWPPLRYPLVSDLIILQTEQGIGNSVRGWGGPPTARIFRDGSKPHVILLLLVTQKLCFDIATLP